MGARRKSSLSKTWLQERKEILQKIKDQVRLYLGPEPSDLTHYAQSYKEDLARPWVPSQLSELEVAIEQSNVILGGDFHPFKQAQRSHLRILRKLAVDRPIVLAVECVRSEHQSHIDIFLKGEMSEDQFLAALHWEETWGFPWSHYKPLFDLAKKHNLPVIGLNKGVSERTEQTLVERDQWAAKVIEQTLAEYSDHLVYVIYGDLHIASEHLPKQIGQLSQPNRPVELLKIFLNSESIYFALAERGDENQVEVVKFNEREYCLLSSPPWVKWHSYLMYLEENFDVDLQWEDEDEWEFEIDHTDHVYDLVKLIGAALQLELKGDDIEVYSLNDPQALKVVEKVLPQSEFDLAHDLIKSDRSFYLPQEGFFYLSKSTVNHAATLAGQYILAQTSGLDKLLWRFPHDFIAVIWIEAMSFLLSKFVNPKRKAQTMSDLKKQLEAFDKEDRGREPLLLALDHKMEELLVVYAQQRKQKTFHPKEKSSYVHASKFIGEILGERYFKLYQDKILDVADIRDLLFQKINSPAFTEFYFGQLKKLDRWESEGSQKV